MLPIGSPVCSAVTQSGPTAQSEKELVRATRDHAHVTKQFSKDIAASAAAVHPAKSMSRQCSQNNTSSKLKKVGVTLIALPDPVTGAIGVPVLAAGFALEKLGNRQLTIPQVTSDLAEAMKELEKLRRNLR